MATVPGGLFDNPTQIPISVDERDFISSFLDSIGLSESSITSVTLSTAAPTTIDDTTPNVTFGVDSGETVDVVLSGTIGKTVIATGSGSANVTGGAGADSILGGSGSDNLSGGLGDDFVLGGNLNDTVFGGTGNDVIYGNQQNDLLYGNEAADTLYGGQDADTVYGGQDADLAYGNLGDDVLYGNLGADSLFGGQGDDTLFGGQGDDTLFGGQGDDSLSGGLGRDLFVIEEAGGADVIVDFDGSGGDLVEFARNANGIDTFGELLSVTSNDASGNAVITLGNGNFLTLSGVNAADLQSGWFTFT